MLSSNCCDQASSTTSTRDVTPLFPLRKLQYHLVLIFTPLSWLRQKQPLPSQIEGRLVKSNNGQFG
ncbi:hypothetical protein DY000_02016747 [Brassica cretica]|uniref:Uncharacterized protein n=1 Tax=Brassica cretica TaxID=69181 RepID=A0ABQ7CW61_BRACR|nr:hypothetical protein DY000_02016747 [Brassica cretica]